MNENFTTKILMIDNDVDTLTKARRILEFEGYSTLCVSTEAEAISALDSYKPSLIISETIFSGYSGFKLIKLLKAKGQDVPVLFLSKNSNPVNHVLAINSGGADFLTKPYDVTVFLAHIKKVITNYEKQKDVLLVNDSLKKLVEIDDLTGLYNMRSLYKKLDYELQRAKRFKRSVAILMIDVDNFKNVNDGGDHIFGSYVLSDLGAIIKDSIRSIDIAARYGGDEFLIMLSECELEGARAFGERLREKVAEYTFENDMHIKKITISTGVAVSNHLDEIDSKELIRQADLKLYEAKAAGRNCVKAIDLNVINKEILFKKII